jgi:hypothetical protein
VRETPDTDYRKTLLSFRDWMHETELTTHRDFDKAIMTLSGGALGISIAFIHNVAPHPTHRWALDTSWSLFALSLLVILAAYLSGIRSIHLSLDQVDLMLEGKELDAIKGKLAHAYLLTKCLNLGSSGSFVLGVVFLVIFAILNY